MRSGGRYVCRGVIILFARSLMKSSCSTLYTKLYQSHESRLESNFVVEMSCKSFSIAFTAFFALMLS